jgi:acyl-CoA thioesterase-1
MKLGNLIIIQKLIAVLVFSFSAFGMQSQETNPNRILVLGDSISAAYGIPTGTGWVNLLQERLKKDQYRFMITNASISGETSAGGKARIADLLKQHQPNIVIVELGANDALRGFPLSSSYQNLLHIVQISKKNGAKVLILGMKIPTNYGADYTAQFSKMFLDLALNTQSPVVPFFLEGVATKRELFLDDGIHPNQTAQNILLNNMLPALKKLLQ